MWEKVIKIFLILLLGVAIGFTWRSLQIDQSFQGDIGALLEMQAEIALKIQELNLALEVFENEGNRYLDNIYPGPYAIQF